MAHQQLFCRAESQSDYSNIILTLCSTSGFATCGNTACEKTQTCFFLWYVYLHQKLNDSSPLPPFDVLLSCCGLIDCMHDLQAESDKCQFTEVQR